MFTVSCRKKSLAGQETLRLKFRKQIFIWNLFNMQKKPSNLRENNLENHTRGRWIDRLPTSSASLCNDNMNIIWIFSGCRTRGGRLFCEQSALRAALDHRNIWLQVLRSMNYSTSPSMTTLGNVCIYVLIEILFLKNAAIRAVGRWSA